MHRHDHDTAIFGLHGLQAYFSDAAPIAGLLVFGLIVGLTHCSGMCGPIIMTRTLRLAAAIPLETVGAWTRLWIGALPAYHAGRALTYTALGGIAGLFGEGIALWIDAKWVGFAGICIAAALVFAPTLKSAHPSASAAWIEGLGTVVARSAMTSGLLADFLTGIALGFLPCGMVYAAIAAAAATGDPILGATAMTAFAFGTWLPLVAIGLLGAGSGRRWRRGLQRWSPLLFALNLAALGLWALHAS